MKRKVRILILCKTYPSPSAKYAETSCVAGMDEEGNLIRLYPVPFRLITSDQQFAKWQWIEASIERSPADRRPESHKIGVDSICAGKVLPAGDWCERRVLLDRLKIYENFDALDKARTEHNVTLGLIKPARVTALRIQKSASQGWTSEEIDKLQSMQRQPSLFEEQEHASIKRLEKVPFDFHYVYECVTDGELRTHIHKIVDWEVSQLYRNVYRKHGAKGWELPFRQKLETHLPSKELMLLMGTIHRFPSQWLIVSLIYPPKRQKEDDHQIALF
ncbi:hypothetical protein G7025_04175 [Pseudomonas lurida]|jgi:hypothetical protein|uniref:hypothetical protein n=1 Tax=Pseudomonas TaxID=286 RepID=UPI001EC174C3|nr:MULTISPECIES: hypothetical protein [Pseudomonas]MBA1292543.1 hypothetical protein [Pseudomonas lurida]MCP1511493.1 hypothetical protein [Pseudomonas rhodesiae]MDF9770318.1 hypothetical protein [Pseudomonas rhodesiae]